jgi:hypothetical protein
LIIYDGLAKLVLRAQSERMTTQLIADGVVSNFQRALRSFDKLRAGYAASGIEDCRDYSTPGRKTARLFLCQSIDFFGRSWLSSAILFAASDGDGGGIAKRGTAPAKYAIDFFTRIECGLPRTAAPHRHSAIEILR